MAGTTSRLLAKMAGKAILPTDFLAAPASNILVQRTDFDKADLLDYGGLYAVTLDNVLSRTECEDLIKGAEAHVAGEWERAKVNIGGGREAYYEDTRKCGRIIWDSQDIASKVWARVEQIPEVQEIMRLENKPKINGNGPSKRGEVWTFSRPNERMRFLKYVGGEYFRPHCDGSYETPDGKERSNFTMHLYLNDARPTSDQQRATLSEEQKLKAAESELVGGATTFHSWNMWKKYDVLPIAGRVLIFQHRDLLHSGDDVHQGVKYTMRTDLMYERGTGGDGMTEAERRRVEDAAFAQAVVAEEAAGARS